MVPWVHGSKAGGVSGFHGSMVPWFHGSIVQYQGGWSWVPLILYFLVPWFHGLIPGGVGPGFHGSMVPWFHCSMVRYQEGWFDGSMVR